MKRLHFSRATSLCAAALALPALLSACSSQNGDAATTADVAANTADTTTADATTENTAADASAADASAAEAVAADAQGATYRLDRQVPMGMSEAQMKKVWVPIPPSSFKVAAKARVRLVTSKGAVVVELNPKAAPLHARSFAYLAKRGYFNSTLFHRRADLTGTGGNIIQGGDPLSRSAETRGAAGQGGPGYTIPRERNALKHDALVIAAARTADPDSAGSQFYITQAPTYFLDEGDGYTVFGRVVAGGDIAKKLRQDDKIIRAQVL